MAVLADNERLGLWRAVMQRLSADREASGLTKADLRAAIDAADAWADANAGSFNATLPQPARGALTAKQKAELLMVVISRRHGVL